MAMIALMSGTALPSGKGNDSARMAPMAMLQATVAIHMCLVAALARIVVRMAILAMRPVADRRT